jgi:hypothetical protein
MINETCGLETIVSSTTIATTLSGVGRRQTGQLVQRTREKRPAVWKQSRVRLRLHWGGRDIGPTAKQPISPRTVFYA